MRRFLAVFLSLAFSLGAACAHAEEAALLPEGAWTPGTGGEWVFQLVSDTALTFAQADAAKDAGVPMRDNILPAGTQLTQALLRALYPDGETFLSPPAMMPSLTQFNLSGEWFYAEDGVLYYRHGEGYLDLTMAQVFEMLNGTEASGAAEKVFYLTIDDAPSAYTMELLAALDALGIKATFFVVGAYVRQRPVFLRAIYEQGHAIANHSYSHDADLLSASYQSCLQDFLRCEQAVEDALGFPLEMPILRIPYGAATVPVAYRTNLQEAGYLWMDWNALNGDTESGVTSDEKAIERAVSTAGRYDGSIVMLVHDGKKRTIRTLAAMVEYFREQGYTFATLDAGIQKIPGVRMGLPK